MLKIINVKLFMRRFCICRSSEGKTVEVPYKGLVENTVLDILGGLRSACTYTGAEHLRELPRRATFIRCTQQLNPMYGSPPGM
jgi:GMP reductase